MTKQLQFSYSRNSSLKQDIIVLTSNMTKTQTDFRNVIATSNGNSLSITLPKKFTQLLSIGKGDFVKLVLLQDNKILLEKVK